MEMIKFELPEKLWRVTKTFLTHEFDTETASVILNKEESYYFRDRNLAIEFLERFNDEIWQEVEIFRYDDSTHTENLRVIAYIEEINSVNLIPHIFDL